jgi:hypothetical protein
MNQTYHNRPVPSLRICVKKLSFFVTRDGRRAGLANYEMVSAVVTFYAQGMIGK